MNLTTKAWFNAIIAKDGFSRPIWMGTTAANAPMNCSAMTDALISRLEQAEAEKANLCELLKRMCDAYKLVCDDSGLVYYQSQGSVYAHCIASLKAAGYE